MTEVCHSVSVEPLLQPLTGEQLSAKSAVTTDEVRADIQARGFWRDRKQQEFFDVKVFNPYAKSYCDTPLANCYRKCELQKKRSYEEHIHEVKHGSFTPLIFSTLLWLRPCTSALQHWYPPRNRSHTQRQWTESDPDWICPPQSNNHVPKRSTLKCQSRGQKQCCWLPYGPRKLRGEDLTSQITK